MRSCRHVAAGLAVAALIAAGISSAGAEEEPLGVRLGNQRNARYGVHPGTRANHAKGAVFEGLFTPAPGADAISSAVVLRGAPTPLLNRLSNSGSVPDAPENKKKQTKKQTKLTNNTTKKKKTNNKNTQTNNNVIAFKFTIALGVAKFGLY